MTVTLITGANKSLGFQTARELVAQGHIVYVGARDPEKGRRAADELGAKAVQLDVTDADSIRAAAEQLQREQGRLDVLVNNAGIPGHVNSAGVPGHPSTATELTAETLREVFETNVFGAAQVLHEFLPLLTKSDHPVVVNVSSGLGSIAAVPRGEERAIPSWIPVPGYAASKAALNMLTAQFAYLLPDLRINTVDPGYTATDFNGHRGTQTVEEGAAIIVQAATVGKDGPTGQFLSVHGPVAW
ncbi:short-chain dehydrogenase [Kribbella sp. ALI-6-A]|uniref:SDR family oxidoreductase n=1 Tax=Kribbella sp. ALI-6-A TaxID=1933817 RepID=UPI00097BBF8A|nr:SDR family oxidoreductase [Kribbella sp. ALI-6-A]ONI68330.1 short-chain dehydrogenase [Kribbella sp. ALI-6-A]